MNRTTIYEYAKDYLAQCHALGFEMRGKEHALRSFADYVSKHGRNGTITTALAVEWATSSPSTSSSYRCRLLSVARTLARYCAAFDPQTEIPPAGLVGGGPRRQPPHIYSHSEIQELLRLTRALKPADTLRPHTYTVVLGLLACTGIRIGEALRLDLSDCHWDISALTIRNSKRLSERLVPLHSSTLDVLHDYAKRRSNYLRDPTVSTFFISDQGRPLSHSTVGKLFQTLRAEAGIRTTGRQPRIHDLRHTFACNRILQWRKEGVPIDHALAFLSAYLGHVEPTDTYWYLSAVPDLLDLSCDLLEQHVRQHSKGGRR